jgi:uncharacterized protein YutD
MNNYLLPITDEELFELKEKIIEFEGFVCPCNMIKRLVLRIEKLKAEIRHKEDEISRLKPEIITL